MNSAVLTFDTLQCFNRLKAVGVPENQAKIQAKIFKEQSDNVNYFVKDHVATKRDLKQLEFATKRDIKELSQETKRDIQELSQETKRDIQELSQETKRDIQELSQETKRDIQELRQETKDLRQETKRDIQESEGRLISRINEMGYQITIKFGSMLAGAVVLLGAFIPITSKFIVH